MAANALREALRALSNISPAERVGAFEPVPLAFVVAVPGASKATSEDEAISLRVEALKDDYGASDVRDLDFHRHHDRPFVHGHAIVGADRVKFRCFVFQEKVESVYYLEPDASVSTDYSRASAPRRKSSGGEPTGAERTDIQREPLHPAEPHFVPVR